MDKNTFQPPPTDLATLTKREYFAGLAMQGIVSGKSVVLAYQSRNTGSHDDEAAYAAVRYADALLAELAK